MSAAELLPILRFLASIFFGAFIALNVRRKRYDVAAFHAAVFAGVLSQ